MQTPQVVVHVRPSEAGLTAAWAVIALDPRRAHLFAWRADGRAVSRCGSALSLAALLAEKRGERLCPACAIERLREFIA